MKRRERQHEPTVLRARRAYWVECSCGFTTRSFVEQWRAQLEWAEHVRDSKQEAS